MTLKSSCPATLLPPQIQLLSAKELIVPHGYTANFYENPIYKLRVSYHFHIETLESEFMEGNNSQIGPYFCFKQN